MLYNHSTECYVPPKKKLLANNDVKKIQLCEFRKIFFTKVVELTSSYKIKKRSCNLDGNYRSYGQKNHIRSLNYRPLYKLTKTARRGPLRRPVGTFGGILGRSARLVCSARSRLSLPREIFWPDFFWWSDLEMMNLERKMRVWNKMRGKSRG